MSKPAHLCITRHGETDWNIAGILQGWSDVSLNKQGRQQARQMAVSFDAAGFGAVWSSPLVRARETAEIIAPLIRLPFPRCHEGLKERNFGAIQGVPKTELAELNPVLLQQIMKRNPATHFEDGETMNDFAERVLGAIAEIGATHPGGRVLIITHGWVMDVVTRHISGLPHNAILNMKRKNGESLWLEVRNGAILQTDQTRLSIASTH